MRNERNLPGRTFWILLVALAVAKMTVAAFVAAPGKINSLGWESSYIAKAMAEGRGFADPYMPMDMHEGQKTSWVAPAYPMLLAGIYRLLGVLSRSSTVAIVWLNVLFTTLAGVVLYRLAARVFNPVVGYAASFLYLVDPKTIAYEYVVWDTCLFTLLLLCVLYLAVDLQERYSWRRLVFLSLAFGFTLLVNAAAILFSPFLILGVLWVRPFDLWEYGKVGCVSFVVVLAVIAPWLIRNYLTFGQFVFIKQGFGVELRIANNAESKGMAVLALHPGANPEEFRLYREMGEPAYNRYALDRALAYIREHKLHFVTLTLKRVVYFWFGFWERQLGILNVGSRVLLYILPTLLALYTLVRSSHPSMFLFRTLFLTFPLVYYLCHVNARYHFPLTPYILMLACQTVYTGLVAYGPEAWRKRLSA